MDTLRWIAIGSLSLSLGCGEAEPGTSVLAEDGSAVRVVRSAAPERGRPGALVTPADLSIGGTEPALTRVSGAVRLDGGGFAVGDEGSASVYFFGADGRLESAVGGAGEGPGEFRILQAIGRLPGDTVWAYDFSLRRFTVVGPDRSVARVVSLRPEPAAALAVGMLPDGSAIVGESWSAARLAEITVGGLAREAVAYLLFDPDGSFVDTLALAPGREVILTQEDGRGVMSAAPLGRAAVHALVGDRLVIGDQSSRVLDVHDIGGALIERIAWAGPDLRVDRTLRDEWRARRLEGIPEPERPAVERALAALPMPSERPAYGAILAAPDGGIWVERFRLGDDGPGTWDLFDAFGSWTGSLSLPPRTRPLEVGDGWLLAVARDDLDVETVGLYRFRAPEADG